jgi:hypothetical protein
MFLFASRSFSLNVSRNSFQERQAMPQALDLYCSQSVEPVGIGIIKDPKVLT